MVMVSSSQKVHTVIPTVGVSAEKDLFRTTLWILVPTMDTMSGRMCSLERRLIYMKDITHWI